MYVHRLYKWLALIVEWCDAAQVTIDMLPDLALLEIFDFYLYGQYKMWRTLVHVSRRWRNVVLGSPRRLKLELFCNARTPVEEMLEVWPPLPIFVCNNGDHRWGIHNIIAALEHNDRICRLNLCDLPGSQLETVLETMEQPFPELTLLILRLHPLQLGREQAPVIPASFLGGSAPHLQTLWFDFIPLPGLPKFLLSATHLVFLILTNIPHFFSPEEMAACLSVLTKLKSLTIDFESFQSLPETNRHPSPQTRALLPVLTWFSFAGVKEYLEDLVAQIDAPLLDRVTISLRGFDSDIPQLTKFFGRTPKLKAHDEAYGVLDDLRRSRYITF